MNSWIKVLLVSAVCGLIEQSVVHADGFDHGSGGDYIRELFQSSRLSLAKRVSELRSCSFQGLDVEASAWILKHETQFVDDILHSPHYWTVDSLATCGFTTRNAKEGIFLSYPTCLNSSNSDEKAKFVLAHESVHHFGISDEGFADRVARTVMASVVTDSCPEEESPFDPNFCDGPPITKNEALRFFTPGESISNYIGASHFRARSRLCNTVSGCGEFTEQEVKYVYYSFDEYGRIKEQKPYVFSHFEPKDDFRLNIAFSSISLELPSAVKATGLSLGCGGNILNDKRDNPSCTIIQPSQFYKTSGEADRYEGKVTNRCFKMVSSYNSDPNKNYGNYVNIEKVWYAEY